MKKAFLILVTVASVLGFSSCGGGGSSTQKPTTTGLTKRAFISNQFFTDINIIDAQTDHFGANLINFGTGHAPTILVTAPGHRTLAAVPSANAVGIIDNATEALTGSVNLPASPTALAITSDGNRGFAAVAGANQIAVLDLGSGAIVANINTTLAPRKLALSHNGSTLIAFSDNIDAIEVFSTSLITSSCTATAVCTLSSTLKTHSSTSHASPSFDRPVNGLFSSDDSTLYVMNCGGECGGTAAGAAAYVVATDTVTADTFIVNGAKVPATIGILDSGSLYVGGTDPAKAGTLGGGQITKINPATMAILGTSVLPDGTHDSIAAQSGKIFIGARGCSQPTGGQQSCLGIYDGSTTAIDLFQGDVTGMAAISGRTVVYVIVGGELKIYDANTRAQTANQLNIVGNVVDVKLVD